MLRTLFWLAVTTTWLLTQPLYAQKHTIDHDGPVAGASSKIHKPVQRRGAKTDCSTGTCSANAGGAIEICVKDALQLNGSLPGVADPVVTWEADPGNSAPLTIDSPHSLITSVSSPGGGDLPVGVFTFNLTVVCSDGTISCDDVTVTIGEIGSMTISDDQLDVCDQSVTVVGSPPNANVGTFWDVQPIGGRSFVQNGNSITITNSTSSAPCQYTVTYYQLIGGCMESVSTQVSFIQSYTNVNSQVLDIDCPLAATLRGRSRGCGGQYQWSVVSTPPGESATIHSPTSRTTDISGSGPGTYTFEYTILNGSCPTASSQVSVMLDDDCDPGICPDLPDPQQIRYITCNNFDDGVSFPLSWPAIPGVSYSWEVVFTTANYSATFDGPNTGPSVDLTVSGTGATSFTNQIIRVRLTAVCDADPSLQITKDFFVYGPPRIEAIEPELFYNCGIVLDFPLTNNLQASQSYGSYTIVSAPADFPAGMVGTPMSYGFNSQIALTAEGAYDLMFVVTNRRRDVYNPSQFIACQDTAYYTVNVTDVPSINPGVDQLLCATSTQLNGNVPLNGSFEPVDIPVLWEQISGPPVTFSATDVPKPAIFGLEYGESYTFKYSFPGDPDCIREGEVTVVVNPEADCCPLKAEVDCRKGCTRLRVEGADEYTISPTAGVTELNTGYYQICTDGAEIYTVTGLTETGEQCGSITVETDAKCIAPPVSCDLELKTRCTRCGCGENIGIGTIYGPNGPINYLRYDIAWEVNGVPTTEFRETEMFTYTGPATIRATVTATLDDGTQCVWTDIKAVNCNGDCPEVHFRTCYDAEFAGLDECKGSTPCFNGDFYGPVWVVDQAGDIITGWGIDWEDDGTYDSNPHVYYPSASSCATGSGTPVRIERGGPRPCKRTAIFDYDCCSKSVVEVECDNNAPNTVRWFQSCNATEYEVTVQACNSTTTYVVPLSAAGNYGTFNFTVPDFPCDNAYVTVRARCQSGDWGPSSDCIGVGTYGCHYWNTPCWFGPSVTTNPTKGSIPVKSTTVIYPNPSGDGKIQVSSDGTVSAKTQLYASVQTLTYKSLPGLQKMPVRVGGYLDLASLHPGVYVIMILDEKGTLIDTHRFVKQ